MVLSALPKYVFRGTTINYEGNNTSIVLQHTSTSINPIKALWFALENHIMFPQQSVVYVANTMQLQEFVVPSNHFQNIEDEIVFNILPKKFISLSLGYLHVHDLQVIMHNLGYNPYELVRVDNLTRICNDTPQLSVNEIETLMVPVLSNLKK